MSKKSWSNNKEGKFDNIVNTILSNGKNGILNNKNINGEPINISLLTKLMSRNNINDLIKSAKSKSGHESNLTPVKIKKILTNYLKKKITPENFREIAEIQAAAKKKANEEAAAKKKANEEAAAKKKANEEAKEKAIQKDTVKKKKKPSKNLGIIINKFLKNQAAKKEANEKANQEAKKKANQEAKKKANQEAATKESLKKINEVKNYLKNLRAQINNRKKSPQFVFLNLDKVINKSLSRKKLTQLLKSGTIIKYLKLICNGKPFYTHNNDEWFLCLTGYVEKPYKEISHQLGLVAYKKDIVSNFSGFRNRTDKLKFITKIFLDLGKENNLTNTKDLTEKIKKYLNSKVKNNNNYIPNEEGFYDVLINNNKNMNVK